MFYAAVELIHGVETVSEIEVQKFKIYWKFFRETQSEWNLLLCSWSLASFSQLSESVNFEASAQL